MKERAHIAQLNSSLQGRGHICKRLRSPEIDSEKSIPPAYVAWLAGTTSRVVVPARQAEYSIPGPP